MQRQSIKASKPSGAKLNRGDKGRLLFERGHVHPAGHGDYLVTSEMDPSTAYRCGEYTGASGSHWECSCTDYRRHAHGGNLRHQCKHIAGVLLYRAAIRQSWQPHREAA